MGVMRKKSKNGDITYVARVRIGGSNKYGVLRRTIEEAQRDSDLMLSNGFLPDKIKKQKAIARHHVIAIERVRSFVRAFIDVAEVESDPTKIKDYCHQLIREITKELMDDVNECIARESTSHKQWNKNKG